LILRKKLALTCAVIAFGASFFLPALDKESGLSCFRDCWRVFTRYDSNYSLPIGGWLYYSGFVAANVLFVVLVGALLYPMPFLRARVYISLAALLQVFSWLVVGFCHVEKDDGFALNIGYFLWLISYMLLFGAHVLQKKMPSQSPEPAPATGTPPAGRESRHV
jgi:hypothetical protein